jgi:hypothetical protein
MHIYIDESGPFLPLTRDRVSAVGALVVPDSQADSLFNEYRELLKAWKKPGEVKGSQLTEREIAAIVELVGHYDVLFDVRAINMGHPTPHALRPFRTAKRRL